MPNKLTIDLTTKELEAAVEALSRLYQARDEYATAKRHLMDIELRMARDCDTVAYLLGHIKEVREGEASITNENTNTNTNKGEN